MVVQTVGVDVPLPVVGVPVGVDREDLARNVV